MFNHFKTSVCLLNNLLIKYERKKVTVVKQATIPILSCIEELTPNHGKTIQAVSKDNRYPKTTLVILSRKLYVFVCTSQFLYLSSASARQPILNSNWQNLHS